MNLTVVCLLGLLSIVDIVMIVFGAMTDHINRPGEPDANQKHRNVGRILWIGGVIAAALLIPAWWTA